jgi:hypothetical protein
MTVLSAFTSSLVSLLATTKRPCFSLQFVRCRPIYLHYQHELKPDVYHLISSHFGLPQPSYWHNPKQG